MSTNIMTPLPKESEQNDEQEDINLTVSNSPTSDADNQFQGGEEKEPVATPKGTCYLSSNSNDEKSPDESNLPRRVQSTHSLLGLAGLEGHEESDDENSMGEISVVTEEQEIMDIDISPTTAASPVENQELEDRTCNTTPPGSVQGPGILSLSPPRLTTYSLGSVTSASVTESFVLQPRPIQPTHRQNHLPHESPRFPPSPKVQQSQLQSQPQPRSRPPRAPHHHSTNPSGNNSVSGGPLQVPRAIMGAGPDSASSVSGRGHKRTSTDATNYSFLSALTDASGGEYSAPRRRTLSWDQNGDSKRGGNALESKSLSGQPTSGSILQPILLPADLVDSRPPMSISTSNLQKALPIAPAPSATTPTRPQSKATLLPAPSSLPAREDLHPLIQKLQQNLSHAKNTSFISPPSHSKENNNIHPLIRKLEESSPSKSGHTTLLTSPSTPFTLHIQDEKKDDDSPAMKQQKQQHARKSSDFGSFSSSIYSSSTVRLQKKTYASPDGSGAFSSPRTINENSATGDLKYKKFSLGDIVKETKECFVETDILDYVEQNNAVEDGTKKYAEDFSFSHWPYLLVALGTISLVYPEATITRFCLIFGAAVLLKRKLSKKFLHQQIIGQCWEDFSRLKPIWAVLDEVSVSASKKKNDFETHTLPFRTTYQRFDAIMDWNSTSLFRKDKITRQSVVESAQQLYEILIQCNGESELKILSNLFCPSQQGRISKFDFMKSIDSTTKATILLEANIRNTSQICDSFDHLVDTLFYTIVVALAPSAIGVDSGALVSVLLSLSISIAFISFVVSGGNLRGITRTLTQKSYGIGDRVCFVPEGSETNIVDGPPSGGWIVENVDLYKTTLRQGITGERTVFPNSSLLSNSSVVNWKRWHKAVVRLSMEFSGNVEGGEIDVVRNHILRWIESHSREWVSLVSFRMIDTGIHRQDVKYELILQHRESWHNYAAVQDSKSDIVAFLRELRKA